MGEKHQCVVASRSSSTGDLAHNPGLCLDWESNRRLLGLQAGAQSREPHEPGSVSLFKWGLYYLSWLVKSLAIGD